MFNNNVPFSQTTYSCTFALCVWSRCTYVGLRLLGHTMCFAHILEWNGVAVAERLLDTRKTCTN